MKFLSTFVFFAAIAFASAGFFSNTFTNGLKAASANFLGDQTWNDDVTIVNLTENALDDEQPSVPGSFFSKQGLTDGLRAASAKYLTKEALTDGLQAASAKYLTKEALADGLQAASAKYLTKEALTERLQAAVGDKVSSDQLQIAISIANKLLSEKATTDEKPIDRKDNGVQPAEIANLFLKQGLAGGLQAASEKYLTKETLAKGLQAAIGDKVSSDQIQTAMEIANVLLSEKAAADGSEDNSGNDEQPAPAPAPAPFSNLFSKQAIIDGLQSASDKYLTKDALTQGLQFASENYLTQEALNNGLHAGIGQLTEIGQREIGGPASEIMAEYKDFQNEKDPIKKARKLYKMSTDVAKLNAKVGFAVSNPVGFLASNVHSELLDNAKAAAKQQVKDQIKNQFHGTKYSVVEKLL